ncbi:sugar phosphate isomerase/epimerase family protein [Winogradskyella pulchriflava]|uniref:Sugar phosphate isomerase/epimerase family protein n=1 Tax=Winogradskyella pulchriflava TaxID=1110688 RepID=A0ABV6Q459_9FLAO
MKNLSTFTIILLLFTIYYSCSNEAKNTINTADITPWCIVPFDALERSPRERMAMLKEMGFTKYGYNWREKHLQEMSEEFKLAKENNIEITSIFLWLNAKRDSIGKLSPLNQKMLSTLKEVEYKPEIWLSFSDNYFEGLSQEQSLNLAIEYIKFIKAKAEEIGCNIALYNHHGWFGNPYNQIEIIETMEDNSLKIVYNFHHAHDYLDEFPEIAKKMTPYLTHVNLNGVKKDGPQILTIGDGDFEYKMMKHLLDEGYHGPWGILGHIETEDVQKVLKRNIEGLKGLQKLKINK